MALYRLTDTDAIVRTADGAWIPNDLANSDCAAYHAWLADGGVPDPAPAAPASDAAIEASAASLMLSRAKAHCDAGDLDAAMDIVLQILGANQ